MDNYRFFIDKNLNKLMKWLRIMGYDTVYYNISLNNLIDKCISENRYFITNNSKIVFDKILSKYSCFVYSEYIEVQLMELSRKISIWDDLQIFCRCIQCNELLKKINKENIKDKVSNYTYNNEESFAICDKCNKIYWKGSHKKYAEKKLRHYKEICLEDHRVRKLQKIVDNTIFEIMNPKLSREDCLNKVVELQQKALELFPGQIETFRIVYLPKLQRIIDSKRS